MQRPWIAPSTVAGVRPEGKKCPECGGHLVSGDFGQKWCGNCGKQMPQPHCQYEPGHPVYERAANEVARADVELEPCSVCAWPKRAGYRCTFCDRS